MVSTLALTVLILIRCRGDVKSELNENESPGRTSRDGGCFFNILYFAQATDCKLRFNSSSASCVVVLIS